MKTLIAAFALLTPAVQPPATPPCINPAEIEHATLFALPTVLEGLAEQCRAKLPSGAYLLTGGAQLSQRLAPDRTMHWDSARAAIVRVAGTDKAGSLGADTATLLIRDLIRAEGGKKLGAPQCATLDRALGLLAPLPAENLAALIALAAETGFRTDAAKVTVTPPSKSAKGKKDEKTVMVATPALICPAPPPAPAAGQ